MRHVRPGERVTLSFLLRSSPFGERGARIDFIDLPADLTITRLACPDGNVRRIYSDPGGMVWHVTIRDHEPGFQGSWVPFEIDLDVAPGARSDRLLDVALTFISRTSGGVVHQYSETFAVGFDAARLTLAGLTAGLSHPQTAQLEAAYGALVVSRDTHFESLDPAVLDVTADGRATTTGVGVARVRLTYVDLVTTVPTEIFPGALRLQPASLPPLQIGAPPVDVQLIGRLPSGADRVLTAQAIWRAHPADRLRVTPPRVEGLRPGVAVLEAWVGQARAEVTVTVEAIPFFPGRLPIERILGVGGRLPVPLLSVYAPTRYASRNPAVVRVHETSGELQFVGAGSTEVIAVDALGREQRLPVIVHAAAPTSAALVSAPSSWTVATSAAGLAVDTPTTLDGELEPWSFATLHLRGRVAPLPAGYLGTVRGLLLDPANLEYLGLLAPAEPPTQLRGEPCTLRVVDRFGRIHLVQSTVA
jgi:hypothetical protein